MALLNFLCSELSYDSSVSVFAKKIDGMFLPGSEARLGFTDLEDDMLLGGFEYFLDNEAIVDQMDEWTEGDEHFLEEAACQLIYDMNG